MYLPIPQILVATGILSLTHLNDPVTNLNFWAPSTSNSSFGFFFSFWSRNSSFVLTQNKKLCYTSFIFWSFLYTSFVSVFFWQITTFVLGKSHFSLVVAQKLDKRPLKGSIRLDQKTKVQLDDQKQKVQLEFDQKKV